MDTELIKEGGLLMEKKVTMLHKMGLILFLLFFTFIISNLYHKQNKDILDFIFLSVIVLFSLWFLIATIVLFSYESIQFYYFENHLLAKKGDEDHGRILEYQDFYHFTYNKGKISYSYLFPDTYLDRKNASNVVNEKFKKEGAQIIEMINKKTRYSNKNK